MLRLDRPWRLGCRALRFVVAVEPREYLRRSDGEGVPRDQRCEPPRCGWTVHGAGGVFRAQVMLFLVWMVTCA